MSNIKSLISYFPSTIGDSDIPIVETKNVVINILCPENSYSMTFSIDTDAGSTYGYVPESESLSFIYDLINTIYIITVGNPEKEDWAPAQVGLAEVGHSLVGYIPQNLDPYVYLLTVDDYGQYLVKWEEGQLIGYNEIIPLNNCSPQTIYKIVTTGLAADMWAIGDSISIELNGITGATNFDNDIYYAYIIGFNHNAEVETNNQYSVTFQFCANDKGTKLVFTDSGYNNSSSSSAGFRMNMTNSTNSGGWEQSEMRTNICDEFFKCLPQSWQDIIYDTIKYSDNVGNNGGQNINNFSATEDKIFILSNYELDGTSLTYEFMYQLPYEYYENGGNSNRIRYRSTNTSTSAYWWQRSVVPSSTSSFYYVNGNGALTSSASSRYSYGFAPALTVSKKEE